MLRRSMLTFRSSFISPKNFDGIGTSVNMKKPGFTERPGPTLTTFASQMGVCCPRNGLPPWLAKSGFSLVTVWIVPAQLATVPAPMVLASDRCGWCEASLRL
jgi:hypothetical protein